MNKSGVTMLELFAVIIIVMILVAVAIPSYVKTIEKTKAGEAVNNLRLIEVEEKKYFLNNGIYAYDLNTLFSVDNPNNSPGRSFDYSVYNYAIDAPNFEAKAVRRNDAKPAYRGQEYKVHKNGIISGPLL